LRKKWQPWRKKSLTFNKIRNLLETGNCDLDFVLNVDRNICRNYKHKNNYYLTLKNEENVSNIKEAIVKSCNKEREMTTFLVGEVWSGQQLPAFIILKGKGVKKIQTILPKNIRVEERMKGSSLDRKTREVWVGVFSKIMP